MEFETRDEETVQDSFEAIGAELASARLDRGMQIAELAQLLRISRHYLKDLESGDHSSLPGATYVSGYIRSVAREVGLDGEEMSQRYRALLDSKSERPTYQFPVDTQQPQRSGAMIASIVVIFAVAGYGSWYAAGKPDVMAGLFGSAEQEVAVVTPQVEITATEPDNLISGDAETQVVAASETVPARTEADPSDMSDDLAAANPGEAAAPEAAGGESETVLAAGDATSMQADLPDVEEAAPAALAAVDAPAVVAPAADGTAAVGTATVATAGVQPVVSEAPTALALDAEAPSAVSPDAADIVAEASPSTELAAALDAAETGDTSLVAGGDGQLVADDSDADALSGGGVAFARQRLPELEITVRATGISWVEIIRNDGEEVMTKLMREGEIYVVDSRDKLYLSTGNAGGLELLFHDGSVRSIGASGEILRDLPLDADRLRNQL